MAKFPALPLWTDAYMGDCSHLSDAEHGRYLRLLMVIWRAPGCRIPNDDGWLARKFGRSENEVREQLRPIITEFCKTSRHFITQGRLTKEMEYVLGKQQKNRDAAKVRWDKEKPAYERNADTALHPQSERNAPTPTPTPTPLVTSRAPASRWPPNKEVGFEWKFDAEQKRRDLGLADIDLHLEGEKFANFWSSKSGKDATKVDWHRTWINWCLNAKGSNNGNGKAPSPHDKFFAAGLSLIREYEGRAAEGDRPDDAADAPGRPLLPR